MGTEKILWREGAFSCEVRPAIEPPQVVVTKDGEDVVEVAARSELEMEERAAELRALVITHADCR